MSEERTVLHGYAEACRAAEERFEPLARALAAEFPGSTGESIQSGGMIFIYELTLWHGEVFTDHHGYPTLPRRYAVFSDPEYGDGGFSYHDDPAYRDSLDQYDTEGMNFALPDDDARGEYGTPAEAYEFVAWAAPLIRAQHAFAEAGLTRQLRGDAA